MINIYLLLYQIIFFFADEFIQALSYAFMSQNEMRFHDNLFYFCQIQMNLFRITSLDPQQHWLALSYHSYFFLYSYQELYTRQLSQVFICIDWQHMTAYQCRHRMQHFRICATFCTQQRVCATFCETATHKCNILCDSNAYVRQQLKSLVRTYPRRILGHWYPHIFSLTLSIFHHIDCFPLSSIFRY